MEDIDGSDKNVLNMEIKSDLVNILYKIKITDEYNSDSRKIHRKFNWELYNRFNEEYGGFNF